MNSKFASKVFLKLLRNQNTRRLAFASAAVAGAAIAADTIFNNNTKDDFSMPHLRKEIKIPDKNTSVDGTETSSFGDIYDYIVCGSGPGAAAWLRTTLKAKPDARILFLERGPYCKTDILTESNPIRCFIDSFRIIADYNHGVMQVTSTDFIP